MSTSRHDLSRRRQLSAEMRRYGINPVSAFDRLFVTVVEAVQPARTLTFVPVPITRVRSRRHSA